MVSNRRRQFLRVSGLALAGALAGCGQQQEPGTETPTETPSDATTDTPTETSDGGTAPAVREITVKQEADNLFYWVTPGPRRFSPEVFGTPDAPRFGTDLLEHRIEQWELDPATFLAKTGTQIEFTYENVGTTTHNFALGAFPLEEKSAAEQAENEEFPIKTETIQPGKTTTATHTPEETGTFPTWCDVAGHLEAGMDGQMRVEE